MQYPVNLNLTGRPCLVVGAGRIALRKVEQLLACGALVTVVAPDALPAFTGLPVTQRRRPYRSDDVVGFRLVVTATGNRAVDQQVFDDADGRGIWVNSADDPDRCTFTLPATVRRGSLLLTASTAGASPALASWLRRRLEDQFGPEWEAVVQDLALARAAIHAEGRSTEDMNWEPIIEAVLAARLDGREVPAQ